MTDAPRPLPPKKDVALALLEGPSLFVHLDPRRAGVMVPKWFTKQPQLVLQIGLNMAIPIPDLKVEDHGITCTLSFNRSPFWCVLPWDAIYALVGEDGRGMVWPDDVPPEVALQMQKQQGAAQKPAPSRRPRAKLSAVPTGDDAARGSEEPAEAEPAAEPAAAAQPAQPAQLTLAASREEEPAPPAAEPVDEQAEPAPRAPSAPGKRTKRELPPYLRVIK